MNPPLLLPDDVSSWLEWFVYVDNYLLQSDIERD
jgi:hypothetical protein